jgi:hypothetical protein
MKTFENFLNEKLASEIWYYGGSRKSLTKQTIEVDEESDRMFFGDAVYVTKNRELALRSGKYLYKVEFEGNFYEVHSLESIHSYGTFKQFLSRVFKDIKDDIIDKAMRNPFYWQTKFRMSEKTMKEILINNDNIRLAEKFIEISIDELFDKYVDNQMGLRDAFEEKGYDGLTDGIYVGIFNPQKSIISIELITP